MDEHEYTTNYMLKVMDIANIFRSLTLIRHSKLNQQFKMNGFCMMSRFLATST